MNTCGFFSLQVFFFSQHLHYSISFQRRKENLHQGGDKMLPGIVVLINDNSHRKLSRLNIFSPRRKAAKNLRKEKSEF